jgi:hypothetical protein
MSTCPEEIDDDGGICSSCNGTGEGQFDGSRCSSCGGSGEEVGERDFDDFDEPEEPEIVDGPL